MTNQPNTIRIERGQTKLYVPHQGREIAFIHPAVDPNNYRSVGAEILKRNQDVPTGDKTASLIYAAYCIPESENYQEFKDVKDIMRKRWLWVFNNNLWTSKGVYVQDDLKAEGRSKQLDVNKLERMLKGGKQIQGIGFSKDKTLRFAPKETYQFGPQTPEQFAKNGFIIASCGKEGAEKLAEASTKFPNHPYVYGVDTNGQEQRVSALCYVLGLRLDFDSDNFGASDYYFAFGVEK